MRLLVFILISLSAATIFADTLQVCSRVDDADDWRLTFNFSNHEVVFFDNDSESLGTYRYSIETAQGVDIFQSVYKNDVWTAKFYGSRMATGNRAELVLDGEYIEFSCEYVQPTSICGDASLPTYEMCLEHGYNY